MFEIEIHDQNDHVEIYDGLTEEQADDVFQKALSRSDVVHVIKNETFDLSDPMDIWIM